MNKKRLAINLAANIISYSTTLLIAFFLTPYLVRTLGKEAYSFYPIANDFTNYIGIIIVALNSMASRFITIELVKGDIKRANIYFASVFFSNVFLTIILFAPTLAIVLTLNHILNIPNNIASSIKILFSLVFGSMLVNILTSVFGVAVFAKNRIDLRSIVEIIQGIMRIVLYIFLFTCFRPNIIYVGIVVLILNMIYFFFHFLFTRKLLPEMKISRKYFNIKAVMEILSSGVWNSVNQLGAMLLVGVNLTLSNMLIDAQAGGDYAIVQTVPTFVNGVISMLTAVFMPIIVQTYAMKNKTQLIKEIKLSQKVLGIITNIPITIFIVIGTNFFSLWVPNQNDIKLQILSIMTIIPLIIMGVSWPISNLNAAMNKLRIPSLVLLGCGLLNVITIFTLIRTTNMGIYAIAGSLMIIELLWITFFIPIYPCKTLGVKWYTFYPAIIRTILGSVLIFFVTIFFKNIIHPYSWTSLFIVCLLSAIIGLLINTLIIFHPKEIKHMITDIKSSVLKRINASR